MTATGSPTAAETVANLDGLRRLLAGPELRPLGLGGILLGEGTLEQLPDAVGRLQESGVVALLADCRPMEGAGSEVKEGIERALERSGIRVRRVTVGDGEARVHADAETIDIASAGCAGSGLIVSVGSGTVADVGKAVSARLGTPHVIVQTAASVNGFADDQSVLLVDGVKRTTETGWPDLLLIDTAVVSRAPVRLNRAGLGDLLATYTARPTGSSRHSQGRTARTPRPSSLSPARTSTGWWARRPGSVPARRRRSRRWPPPSP